MFPRRENASGSCINIVPHQAEGAGNAGATIAPAVSCQEHEGSHHRYAERSGIPRAMVLRLIRALPGEPGLFATVPPGLSACQPEGRPLEPQGLIPASGGQDHTTSPSATRILRLMMPSQPSHPAPRFVTIGRNVPLAGTGRGEAKPLICPTAQAKFSRRGSSIAATGLNGLAKLIFRRMQCRVDPAGQFRGKTGLA